MDKRMQEIKTNERSELVKVQDFFNRYVLTALKKDNLDRRHNIAKNQAD